MMVEGLGRLKMRHSQSAGQVRVRSAMTPAGRWARPGFVDKMLRGASECAMRSRYRCCKREYWAWMSLLEVWMLFEAQGKRWKSLSSGVTWHLYFACS